jgi:hypothetical protein
MRGLAAFSGNSLLSVVHNKRSARLRLGAPSLSAFRTFTACALLTATGPQVERDVLIQDPNAPFGAHEDGGVFLAVNDSKGRAKLLSLVQVLLLSSAYYTKACQRTGSLLS